MYDSVVFEDLFLIRVVPDQYKTQQMCYKAVNDCLAGMKLVPDLFATSQMIPLLLCTQVKIYFF